VIFVGDTDLMQIAGTANLSSRSTSLLHGRDQQRNEDADNRDNHQ
jgi:hypothetical protein